MRVRGDALDGPVLLEVDLRPWREREPSTAAARRGRWRFGGRAAAAAARRVLHVLAVIRPLRPLPLTPASDTPSSRANRRTDGLA